MSRKKLLFLKIELLHIKSSIQIQKKVANGLVSENVAEQDRVAYMDKNSDRFYELVMGCAKSNSVIVGIIGG